MKVAIPHWQGRISPVFDVAGHVLVIDVDGDHEVARHDVALQSEQPQARAALLAGTGAQVLVCGAISRPLEMAILAAGIEVIPQTCGEIDRVLSAFINEQLDQDAFLMPGSCGRRRRPATLRRHRGS